MFRVASKGRIYHGDFRIIQEAIPTIIVAVLVKRDSGKPTGVLVAQIHLKSVWDVVTETRIGRRGFAYVVDREGTLISHPDTHRVFLQINMRHFPMVNQVVAGNEGNLEFEHPRGERFLFVFKPIKELDWGVVVQVPVEEAYQPIQAVTRTALIWIFLSLVVAMIFSLLFTRRLVHPIKRLSGEMAKVSKGDLNVHIEPTGRDEIGLLGDSFNRMVEDLKHSQEAFLEAERKYRRVFENSKDMIYITSVDGKFVDVNQAGVDMLGYTNRKDLMNVHLKDIYLHPEDRKKFQSEITQRGFVKDFEVKLKRKDGSPMDCLITSNMRKEEEGVIIGYEGIIKDISFRKNAEKELVQKTEQLQTLYDLSVLINQTLDLDEVLPIALDRATHLTDLKWAGSIYSTRKRGSLN
jgi:PAS domain S-box-containing protein